MILIAGATGYIGTLLAQRLASEGEPPRCLARDRTSAGASKLQASGCEVVEGDVLEPESLDGIFDGIETAYYLVHSMGRGGDGDFADRDRRAADNFGAAAKRAGVKRIIYLGGLGEGGSKHLRSRHETAEHLAAHGIPLTYFRAAVVIGAGSESLRTVVFLVKRLPAMVTPRWTTTKTQPIAIDDVVAFLSRAPRVPESEGREIQIGGPEVTTYGGLLDDAARALDLKPRPRIGVPALSPKLSSLWIGLITPVDSGVARPLVEGLSTETIVTDPSGMELFEIEPTPIDRAMREAVQAVG